MGYMFRDISSAQRDYLGLGHELVTDMYQMFYKASAFNADISGWNTSLVTNMGICLC